MRHSGSAGAAVKPIITASKRASTERIGSFGRPPITDDLARNQRLDEAVAELCDVGLCRCGEVTRWVVGETDKDVTVVSNTRLTRIVRLKEDELHPIDPITLIHGDKIGKWDLRQRSIRFIGISPCSQDVVCQGSASGNGESACATGVWAATLCGTPGSSAAKYGGGRYSTCCLLAESIRTGGDGDGVRDSHGE